jgi:antitoxin MazE
MMENAAVELSRVDNNVVVSKVKANNELTLDDIFKDYDGELTTEEYEWDSPIGREVW